MGSSNIGNQILSFDYKDKAIASTFNKLNYKILPTGIYSGGTLSVTDAGNEEVTVAPMVVYFYDNDTEVAVRIETQSSVVKTLDSTTPYIICKFDWNNVQNNYMDIDVASWSTINTYLGLGQNIIILGKGIYSGITLTSNIEYTVRSVSSLQLLEDRKNYFRVTTTEISSGSVSNKVYVYPGKALLEGNNIDFAGGETASLSNTTSGRIDLIYLNNDGTIDIVEGVDAGSPTEPDSPTDGVILAKITRGASRTDVKAEDITQINFTEYLPLSPRKPVNALNLINEDMRNLTVTKNSSNPTYQLDVDADVLQVEEYSLSSINLTIDITSSGANGLDTGSEASDTWYSVWVVYNPTTDTIAGLLSTSETSPTMPSGYTKKRMVGHVRNDSSSDFGLTESFGEYYHERNDNPSNYDYDTGSFTLDNTYRDLDLSSVLPPGAKAVVVSAVVRTASSLANTDYLFFRKKGQSGDHPIAIIQANAVNVFSREDLTLACDSDRVIQYKSGSSSSNIVEVHLSIKAWYR